MSNTLPVQARFYVPDSPTVAAPTLVAGNLTGYTPTVNELDELPRTNRLPWNAETPKAKYRLFGLDPYGNPAPTDWSSEIAKAAALGAGEALQISIPSAQQANRPIAVQVAVSSGGTNPFYAQPPVPLNGFSMRSNSSPADPLIIKIAGKPSGNEPIDTDLPGPAPTVKGAKSKLFNFGLGDDGLGILHKLAKFESRTDAIDTTFLTGGTSGITFSVNPADSAQLENLLPFFGYRLIGGAARSWGAPLESTQNVICVDLDIPYVNSSLQNRLFLFSMGARTIEDATLSAALLKKEPFTISLNFVKTQYIHQAHQIVYTNL